MSEFRAKDLKLENILQHFCRQRAEQLREKNDRLSLVFANISTLEKAIDTLEEVLKLN
ncbi:MAG: hypothetical protein HQ500_10395 [Flavobacteriales bacterium]|nr:hypothetical protein [Flavobacteriales bacterium]